VKKSLHDSQGKPYTSFTNPRKTIMQFIVFAALVAVVVAARVWTSLEIGRWQANDPRLAQLLRQARA
jgi:hypothetical protein